PVSVTHTHIHADPLTAEALWREIARHKPAPDLAAATDRYLGNLVDRYRYLDFRGMGITDRVALKLPLLIFLVLLANGLINGMFASLLGSGLSFQQTLMMSMVSFTTVSLILGALSPVTFFMALNAPAPDTPEAARWHQIFLVSHTALIAYAGVVGNYKAYLMLARFTGNLSAARRTFLAWLAVNLFVGAQLSFILRPFFGNPAMDVQFLRPNAFDGSFYEVLLRSLQGLTQ
ncbi:MAG: hypothetical protein GY953_56950, partial [bacterium]|nr:hypothetical protein [bacterium]